MNTMLDINWWIVIVDPEGNIFDDAHFVGYKYKPTDIEIEELKVELLQDDEFNWTDKVYGTDYFFKIVPGDELKEFLQ